jgi:hypothetical protein
MKESQAFVAILSAFTNILRKLDEQTARADGLDGMLRQLKPQPKFEPPKGMCGLCGEPMPAGEEMFKFHGLSGPCPKNHLTPDQREELRKSLPPVGEL